MESKYAIIKNTNDGFTVLFEDRSHTIIAAAKHPNGTWSVYIHTEHMHVSIDTYRTKKTAVKKVLDLANSTTVY